MTPSPEQIAECQAFFLKAFPDRQLNQDPLAPTASDYIYQGYRRARTEQAAEIAELKARLAEIKRIVCGEAKPRWDNSPQTTQTRGRIADVCELSTTNQLLKG